MRPEQIIRKKRDGLALSSSEMKSWIHEYAAGRIQDDQMAAWLMAVYFRGLSDQELRDLINAMVASGKKIPRADRSNYWIDKHSTGGVGDKTSLLLVPLVSTVSDEVFGPGKVKIPMVSGRTLGHTGGTLDKLESVPGFKVNLNLSIAAELLETSGFVMMGQTEEMVPADRLMYALRDATSTVDSLPLIVASILSKKLAEDVDGIVFDVKFGSGAIMKDLNEARQLAMELNRLAKEMGVHAVSVLSRMDFPLGRTVGNRLEVEECWDVLQGNGEAHLKELTMTLASQMLTLAGRGTLSLPLSRQLCEEALQDSRTIQKFIQMFEQQGGNWNAFLNEPQPTDLVHHEIQAYDDGFLHQIDAYEVAEGIRALGGGRYAKDHRIDPWVGLKLSRTVGEPIFKGESLGYVVARKTSDMAAIERVKGAFKMGKEKPKIWSVVEEIR